MSELGKLVRSPGRVYLTGGATAVMLDWRQATLDIDIKPLPDSDEVFRAIAKLKNQIDVNIELASPGEFIPPLPGWEDRSQFIARYGSLDFFHYDFYSQALSKIERGHSQDEKDVREMFGRNLIDADRISSYFEAIRPGLIRYPAIDEGEFENKIKRALLWMKK